MNNRDISTLALGSDVKNFGLDMSQPDDQPLYSDFVNPWSKEKPTKQSAQFDPDAMLPACYDVQAPPAVTKIKNFSERTLFYIFYTMPQDTLQLEAARELSRRGWIYHKELRLWLLRDDRARVYARTAQYERGEYIFFDPQLWQEVRQAALLMYDQLQIPTWSNDCSGAVTISEGSNQQQQQQSASGPTPSSTPSQLHPGLRIPSGRSDDGRSSSNSNPVNPVATPAASASSAALPRPRQEVAGSWNSSRP